jgi:hypothetical protein
MHFFLLPASISLGEKGGRGKILSPNSVTAVTIA